MKNKPSDDEIKEIGYTIRTWILTQSNVAKFCRDNKFATSTVDNWLAGNRGPSLENALRLEVLSKGELTKEFLCPQYNW